MEIRSNKAFTLAIGFGLLLMVLLIVILVIMAKQLTHVTLERSSEVVELQQKKLNHLMNLHIAGQSRTIHLQQMILQSDPIDQDQAFMKFYQNASDYMSHRDQIGELLGNNEFEVTWFDQLHQMAKVTGPLQNRIADLALTQNKQDAIELLNSQGMFQLYAFTEKVQAFAEYQEQAIRRAIQQSRNNVDDLMQTVLGLAIAIIFLSLVFALLLIQKFGHINRALRRSNDELEERVKERTFELTQTQTELLEKNRSLELLSSVDPLTGLYNRFKMDQFLSTAHERFMQHGEPYHIMFIDIDHFKPINDEHGHETGDEILKGFADLLTEKFGDNNLIGRWGGEEFIILHAGQALQLACEEAEHIRQTVEAAPFYDHIPVTVSIGVAKVDYKDQIKDVINRADIALYKAKNTGRNRVEKCQTELNGHPN